MKVLHLLNQLSVGGAEKLILETIPLYNKKGIQADVIVHKSTKDDLFLNQLKQKRCCNIIELKYNSVYNPAIILKLIPYLKKYDIIHAHLFPGFYFLVLAKFFFKGKVKLIYTEHNTSNRRMRLFWVKWVDKFIYKEYAKVICITKEIQEILNSYIPFKKKDLMVIENGITLDTVKQGKSISIIPNKQEEQKIITQISAFRPQKDHPTLIKSLKHLPKEIILVLAGDGETIGKCKELVKKLKLSKRVFFLGNRPDISNIMASSDILVLSSHHEGLSLSSIEAMASGKPFLASRVPGLAALINGAGVLFELGNEKDLAQKVLELLNDETLYNTIVKSGQKRAEQYDISIMVEKHINLYHETIN